MKKQIIIYVSDEKCNVKKLVMRMTARRIANLFTLSVKEV